MLVSRKMSHKSFPLFQLELAGLIKSVGEVHDGDTVTDFLDAERERGITISSAAITMPWSVQDKP